MSRRYCSACGAQTEVVDGFCLLGHRVDDRAKGATMPAPPTPPEEAATDDVSPVGDLRARVDKTFEDALDEVSAALDPVRDLLSPPPPPGGGTIPSRATSTVTESLPKRAVGGGLRKPEPTLRNPEPTIRYPAGRTPAPTASASASATPTVERPAPLEVEPSLSAEATTLPDGDGPLKNAGRKLADEVKALGMRTTSSTYARGEKEAKDLVTRAKAEAAALTKQAQETFERTTREADQRLADAAREATAMKARAERDAEAIREEAQRSTTDDRARLATDIEAARSDRNEAQQVLE
ncbi:MAG: hypothetical protein QOC87_2114, partial [Actinomycetota bacterium]|nr:hypothetical protein [Actinomycetota bacterium]